VLLALAALTGCAARGPAPVAARAPAGITPAAPAAVAPQPLATRPILPSSNGLHTVARGDTLYAIAFANNLDHRDIAAWNQLSSPDLIRVGEVLRLTPPPNAVEVRPLDAGPELRARPLADSQLVREPQAVLLAYSDANWARVSGATRAAVVPTPAAAVPAAASPGGAPAPAIAADNAWLWPADGVLAGRFGGTGGKGIDIVGARQSPVRAAAPGKVVYSGSGLRGYGRLLIVKHAGEFLSAYAHNDSVLVKEGDTVAAGQQIALMGDSDADRVKLHFEIRRYGKPLDPMDYLPERS
jgi:lipoprotein NlpD